MTGQSKWEMLNFVKLSLELTADRPTYKTGNYLVIIRVRDSIFQSTRDHTIIIIAKGLVLLKIGKKRKEESM